MGNIKAKQGNDWIVIASDNANGVAVTNVKLQKEEDRTSVDDVLENHEDRVGRLERNVAWLAKHGIGTGGGGGGGSTSYEATCDILVNQVSSGETVFFDTEGLAIELVNIVNASKRWNISVSIGNEVVYTASASKTSPRITVAYDKISPKLTNHSGLLYISAVYDDEANNITGYASWNGTLIESVVNLSVRDVTVDFSGQDLGASDIAHFDFSVGITGDYNLTVKVSKDGNVVKTVNRSLSISTTAEQGYNIPLSELITSPEAGIYELQTSLTYVRNENITASVGSHVSLISKTIFITSNILSADSSAPIEISTTGAFNLNWIAYVSGASTFSYKYIFNYGSGTFETNSKVGYFGTTVQDTISVLGQSWVTKNLPITLTIEVTASSTSSATKTYYFKIVESSSTFIEMRESVQQGLVSRFEAREKSSGESSFALTSNTFYRNMQVEPLTTNLVLHNNSTLAGISSSVNAAPYLRLCNGAYGTLTLNNAKYSNSLDTLIAEGKSQSVQGNFTISTCFKADYHPDDDRTILFWGRCDNSTGKIITGIEIGVHYIYVNQTPVFQLTDNVINMVDITCERNATPYIMEDGTVSSAPKSIIKIYVNGVVSASVSYISDNGLQLSDTIYIGSKVYGDGLHEEWCCDCNIYNLHVYDTCLKDFDIMLNNTNNKVTLSRANGEYNFGIIDEELKRNLCYRDTDGKIKSIIYDIEQNTYKLPDFIDVVDGEIGLSIDASNIAYAEAVGIPIMFIDANDANWTFNAFTAQQTAGNVSLSATNFTSRIQYWDPNSTNNNVITLRGAQIDLQGTSTLADAVKNLNVTLPNDAVFIPKKEWLPEQTYTLKADVVDSSHSCNAAIGKFVNTVLNDWMPAPDNARNNVLNSNYVKTQQPEATFKHTVEGFPVFLIMNFHINESSSIRTTPLGIYSFNLGRAAHRNLGFEIINSITDNSTNESIGEITTYPYARNNCTISITNADGRWVEIKDLGSVDGLKNIDHTSIPDDLDSSKGDFWQDDLSIIRQRYEVKYPVNGSFETNDSFANFVHSITILPIEGTYETIDNQGNVEASSISQPYNKYRYNNAYVATGAKVTPLSNTNDYPDPTFSVDSAYKYFTLACAFGLADNLGKNSTYRKWANSLYYLGLYDLDCAFGGGNQGALDIFYNMWLKYLKNKKLSGKNYGYAAETFDDNDPDRFNNNATVFSGSSSKLWLSIDTSFFRRATGQEDTSRYSLFWREFRAEMETIAIRAGYSNFIDYFVEEFFLAQTRECGALLFNLDYKLKYFVQFTSNTYDNVKFLSKLHGRREAYTRDWLKKRFLFLDSLFYWRSTGEYSSFSNDLICRMRSNVYSTPEVLPVKYNTDLIIHHNVGDGTKTYYYVPANTEVMVEAGNNSSNSVLTWGISNSPQLIKLGNDNIPLSNMHVATIGHTPTSSENTQTISSPGLCSMTELDLSGNDSFATADDVLISFIPTSGYSELRTIDFSNTSSKTGVSFTLPLATLLSGGILTSRFTKLRSINISGSTAVNDITLPPIPLKELSVSYSSLIHFNLTSQRFIESVDLTGCSQLLDVTIQECESYKTLVLSNLSNLQTVTVHNNVSIESIIIDNCPALTSVNIERNPMLTTVSVSNCRTLTGTEDKPAIQISVCENLTEIDFNNDINLSVISLADCNWSNINKVDLSYTSVTKIVGGQTDTDVLDLSKFIHSSSTPFISIAQNKAVKEIQFANDANNPIVIGGFQGCENLERIYGNILIYQMSSDDSSEAAFYNCTKFTVHGDDADENKALGPMTFKGKSTREDNNAKKRVKSIWEIFGTAPDYNDVTWNQVYQTGNRVTNLRFSNRSSLYYTFNNTSLTQFDIYYTTYAIAISFTSNDFTIRNTWFDINRKPGQYGLFVWDISNSTNAVDNKPSRYLFKGWSRCTQIYEAFSSAYTSKTYVLSPEFNSDGATVKKDNGVFSPLVKLTNLVRVFGYTTKNKISYDIIISYSRHLFRRTSSGGNYRISYLGWQSGNGTCYDSDEQAESLETPSIQTLGNFTDFFLNMPNLTTVFSIFQCDYIDFDTIHLPNSLAYLYRSFWSSTGAKGTLDFSDSNKQFAGNNLVYLFNSFICPASNLGKNNIYGTVYFNLNNSTFSRFRNLQGFGYDATPSANANYGNISQFACQNTVKVLTENSFPYKIFENNPSLRIATNVFQDCDYPNVEVEFPGNNMFASNRNLQYIPAFFKNCNMRISLVAEGFINCPNLKDVHQLFYNDLSKGYNHGVLNGISIPYKFLYHGSKRVTITRLGTTQTAKPADSIYNEETGKYVPSIEPIEETRVVDVPNTSIFNVSQMFYGCCLMQPYTVSDVSEIVEDNPDYSTLKWFYNSSSGIWTENTETKQRQAYWGFDGTFDEKYTAYNSSFFAEDSNIKLLEKKGDFSIEDISYGISNELKDKQSLTNYICPPDLLRYCTSTCTVSGLFEYCGRDVYNYGLVAGSSSSYVVDSEASNKIIGIRGRICPYMLKPVGDTTNIDRMFKFCRNLSCYQYDSNIYLIPPTFFSYAPKVASLIEAFEGMGFAQNVNLAVFNSLRNPLDIRKIFAASLYAKITSPSVAPLQLQSVFSSNTISRITGAFATNDLYLNSNGVEASFKQYWTVPHENVVIPNNATNFKRGGIPNASNTRWVYNGWGITNGIDTLIQNNNNNY